MADQREVRDVDEEEELDERRSRRAGGEAEADEQASDRRPRRRDRDGGRRPVRPKSAESRPADSRPRASGSADQQGSLTAADAAKLAARQISELTGKRPEGVTGLERADDGWIVGIEVVEDRRIPSSTDILAVYEAEFDGDGELVSYRRVKRYPRGRGDDGNGGGGS